MYHNISMRDYTY